MTSGEIPPKKLKILCMHGYGTNAEFMKMQTDALRKDVGELAEFIFVNGPNVIPLETINDPKVVKNIVGNAYSWYDFKTRRKMLTS